MYETVGGFTPTGEDEWNANAAANTRYRAAQDIADRAAHLNSLWADTPWWLRPRRPVRRATLAAYATAARTSQAHAAAGYVGHMPAVPSINLDRLLRAADAGHAWMEPTDITLARHQARNQNFPRWYGRAADAAADAYATNPSYPAVLLHRARYPARRTRAAQFVQCTGTVPPHGDGTAAYRCPAAGPGGLCRTCAPEDPQ